jgi:hypothetical protein
MTRGLSRLRALRFAVTGTLLACAATGPQCTCAHAALASQAVATTVSACCPARSSPAASQAPEHDEGCSHCGIFAEEKARKIEPLHRLERTVADGGASSFLPARGARLELPSPRVEPRAGGTASVVRRPALELLCTLLI